MESSVGLLLEVRGYYRDYSKRFGDIGLLSEVIGYYRDYCKRLGDTGTIVRGQVIL